MHVDRFITMEVAPVRLETTVGILVAYDPATDPRTALKHLAEVLAFVIIVDNAAGGHPLLPAEGALPGNVRLLRHGNRGGLAGAYNVALDLIFVSMPGARHVVFVDEDSDVDALSAFIEHEGTLDATSDKSVAAVAPAHRDRLSGLRASHVILKRFSFKRLPRDVQGVVQVAFVINSLSLWSLGALRHIGPFDEALGIDQVDIDYCLRARQCGYKVYLNGDCEFAHSIGRRRLYFLLGRQFQTGGHSAARRYLIGRNTIWLAKRYLTVYPAMAVICLFRIVHEGLGIAVAEADKFAKLKQLAKGVLVGSMTSSRPVMQQSMGREP